MSARQPADCLQHLEKKLGHRFERRSLLDTARTHPSYAHEHAGVDDNERLEFLGDAVLDLVVAQLLYATHPDWSEGELTHARASLVNARSLTGCARELDLGRHLRLGKTEQLSHGAEKESILANVLEAMLGAVYLDGGLAPVVRLAERIFASALDPDAPRFERDPKSRFQEWVMARFGEFPTYELVGDTGVDADEQRFSVRVLVMGEGWGQGNARSKRNAERLAAEDALRTRVRDG